jgi:hypothetical protein
MVMGGLVVPVNYCWCSPAQSLWVPSPVGLSHGSGIRATLVGGQIHVQVALSSGKEAEWGPRPIWTLWRRENTACDGNRIPIPRLQSRYPVAVPTELESDYLTDKGKQFYWF